MKNGICAAFLFDGFADSELSLFMAALNRTGNFQLETFSARGRAVTARSGLRVLPQTSLAAMDPEDFDLLLLVGGQQWEKGDNLDIFPLIQATVDVRPVAAVGSAILSLADLGLLDRIPHTGECPGYFSRYCPEYGGETWFRQRPWVSSGAVLTITSEALAGAADNLLALFDTLQSIYANNHELFDPAC